MKRIDRRNLRRPFGVVQRTRVPLSVEQSRRRVALLQFALSLVLALALWTFVSFTQNPTITASVEVPISTTPPAPGLVVVEPNTGLPTALDQVINVQVSGPRTSVTEVGNGDVSATLDIETYGAGVHTVPLDIETPRGVRLQDYAPQSITLRLEPAQTQTFAVEPAPRGQPPFVKVENDAIQSAVSQVQVSGPRDAVARVAQVQAMIDLRGRAQGFTENAPLQAVDQTGAVVPGVILAPDQTMVTVNVEPQADLQNVSVVPQFVGQPASPYVVERFDWSPKSIEVIAPPVITSTLETEAITLNGRTTSFTQTVRLANVDDVLTRAEDPEITVEVQITSFGVASNTPLFVPSVTPQNVQPGLRPQAPPAGLTIIVSGTYQQLNQLAGAELQATVDATGRGPGTHQLPVTINLPAGVQLVGDAPTTQLTLEPSTPSPSTAPATPQASASIPGE